MFGTYECLKPFIALCGWSGEVTESCVALPKDTLLLRRGIFARSHICLQTMATPLAYKIGRIGVFSDGFSFVCSGGGAREREERESAPFPLILSGTFDLNILCTKEAYRVGFHACSLFGFCYLRMGCEDFCLNSCLLHQRNIIMLALVHTDSDNPSRGRWRLWLTFLRIQKSGGFRCENWKWTRKKHRFCIAFMAHLVKRVSRWQWMVKIPRSSVTGFCLIKSHNCSLTEMSKFSRFKLSCCDYDLFFRFFAPNLQNVFRKDVLSFYFNLSKTDSF